MKNKLKDLNKILIIGFIGITLGLTGCDDEKDEIIEETGIKYTFSLSNSLPGLAPRITQESITFTKAEIRVIELVFDAEGPNGSISITEPLTSVIDVIANIATPELTVIELTPGTYTSINMGIELRDEDNTPSIDLKGIFSNKPKGQSSTGFARG
ncbi:MAG: hypothetical protein IIB45_05345 [Candidatus Marinimicrobia bacterium]|nr:hypothetical protein [Candidatus Neomarinimicrobiota bacterium]